MNEVEPVLLYCWNRGTEEVYPCPLEEWSAQLADAKSRRVARWEQGPMVVSTMFVGAVVDDSDPPLLWESAVFGVPEWTRLRDFKQRYASYSQAKLGHETLIEALLRALSKGRPRK